MSARAPLSERDVSYLKLLKTLKTASTGGAGAELGVVRRIATWIDSVAVLDFICGHQPWFDDWEVKEGLIHNDATPLRHRQELEKAIAIFELLHELDDPAHGPQERTEIQEDIRYLFTHLPEHDRGVVKAHAYELSASRREGPSPAGAVARTAEAPVPARPEAVADAHDASIDELTGDLPADGSVTETLRQTEMEALAASELEDDAPAPDVEAAAAASAPHAALPLAQRVALARSSTEAEALGSLAYDTHEEVVLALVQNPALNDRLAAVIAQRATGRVAAEIHRNRRLFMRPLVQQALLECPNAPSAALLEIVNSMGNLRDLMKLLSSPKVKFLEVKAKARARLSMIFKSLGTGEKLQAIRSSGRSMLKELWTDFFRDEQLVIKCLQEKQVDQGIVLEIARSKVAPRRALELIAASPSWLANYQVMLELVMNPKTPRQVVAKLIPKLKPADRKMIKSNPALPEAIRKFA